MTQYSTNANLSTDAASTFASADSTDGNESDITGYTVTHLTNTFGDEMTFTVTTGGDYGGRYIVSDNSGSTLANKVLATNDMSVGTGTEFDVLLRFRIPEAFSNDLQGPTFFHGDTSSNTGYGIRVWNDGDAQLYYITTGGWWQTVGAKTTPTAGTLTNNTWYWLRVHRTDSAGSYKWSWVIDTSVPTGWDLGDGGSGGTANSDQTTGKIGIGVFEFVREADYDWFSCADAGDSAPGPDTGTTITVPTGPVR
jgi:hypothetical protein